MSDSAADILRRADTWLMDGTYKVRPKPYYQVNNDFEDTTVGYIDKSK